MKNIILITLLSIIGLFINIPEVDAAETSKMGIHILNIVELEKADQLFSIDTGLEISPESSDTVLGVNIVKDEWNYVTVPFTHEDVENRDKWQEFFDKARDLKITPLVRLATQYSSEQDAWIVPTRKQIVEQMDVLSSLTWPSNERNIIVYNEVNHAKEWGGSINPEEYARTLEFVANWAHTEEKNYVVLPAAMDLAAPNGRETMEAFNYLRQMNKANEGIFELVDVWNSHSYPNPGFSSAPTRYGKNSLRGFTYELAFLKQLTGKDYKVMITETGWKETGRLGYWLPSYYTYAMQHIWSDDRVLAVTPFILQGSPGPFSGFSFLDEHGEQTTQYRAYQDAMRVTGS